MGGNREERTGQDERTLVVDGVFSQEFPRLARLLGEEERQRLAREFVRSRPFYRGGASGLERMLPEFLSVALAEDPQRGAWLAEFAQLEGALGRAGRAPRADASAAPAWVESFAFEHRVDELMHELNASGDWRAPRPANVRLGVFAERDGPRWAELTGDGSALPAG